MPPFLGTRDPCTDVPSNEFTHMGFTIRTQTWRYTEWPRWQCRTLNDCPRSTSVDWGAIDGVELYSHVGDDGSCFDCFEGVNLAGGDEYAAVVAQLSYQLRKGWRSALPTSGFHAAGAGAEAGALTEAN